MKPLLWTILLAISPPALCAPFCVVSGAGTHCMYYNVQNCQRAASTSNGMCVPNQEPATPSPAFQPQPRVQFQPPPMYMPDIVGSAMSGYERGRRARQENDEHEARMRLIEAQTQAAQASVAAANSAYQPAPGAGILDACKAAVAIADGSADRIYSPNDAHQVAMAAGYCMGFVNGYSHGAKCQRAADIVSIAKELVASRAPTESDAVAVFARPGVLCVD